MTTRKLLPTRHAFASAHFPAFRLIVAAGAILIACHFTASIALAANLTVNSNQIVTNTIAGVATPATLGDIAIGMNTSVYYNNIDKSYMSPALDNAGVSIVRYPGGNFSDIYHWTNNVATGGYSATSSNFGSFAKSILNGPSGLAKQAMITVNYGASLNDTMGGQPQEAAAWVAYANGTIDGPNATMQLGTDGEGHNWGTVRYWAALRAQIQATIIGPLTARRASCSTHPTCQISQRAPSSGSITPRPWVFRSGKSATS